MIRINRTRLLQWQRIEPRHNVLSGNHRGCYWYVYTYRNTVLTSRGGYDYDVKYKFENGARFSGTFFGVEKGDGISVMELAQRKINFLLRK